MTTRLTLAPVFAILAMIGWLPGCRAVGRPSVAMVAKVGFDTTVGSSLGQGGGSLRLAGAIGEVLGVHFTVRAGDSTIVAPQLSAEAFRGPGGTIGGGSVEMFRLHAVRVDRWAGWHIRSIPAARRDPTPLDVLVPLDAPHGGIPNLMSPGVTYHFWADVRIPLGVRRGVYHSRIVLSSEGRLLDAIDIELTVWPMVLPHDLGIEAVGELDDQVLLAHHFRAGGRRNGETSEVEMRETLFNALRRLRRHRIAGVYPTLAPGVGISGSTRLALDWKFFDSVVGPVLSGEAFEDRSPGKRWPIPINASVPLEVGQPSSRRRLLSRYLVEAIQHFGVQGWESKAYILCRDPVSGESLSPWEVASLIGPLRKRVSIVATDPPQKLDEVMQAADADEGHDEVVDEWAPAAQFLDRESVRRERAVGRASWLRVDRPPYSGTLDVSAPTTYARVLAWQAASVGASQLYLGKIVAWPDAREDASPEKCLRVNPGNLLYPGTIFGLVEPVMSLRLKRLRRGLQDMGYLRLLREHGRSAIADRVLSSVVAAVGVETYDAHFADGSRIGWPRSEGAFDAARRVMVEEMLRVVSADGGDSDKRAFSRTAAWGRLKQMTRPPEIVAQGVRMHMTGSPAHPRVKISAHAVVDAGLDGRGGSVFRLEDWPETWQVDVPMETLRGSDNSREGQEVLIETVVPLEKVSIAGSFDLTGVAEFDGGRRATAAVPLRCVTALRCVRAPTIDGDLSDWPMGTTNVLKDFRSIAGAEGGDDLRVRTPRSPTVAFVMRDDSYLYFAINASTTTGTTS